MAVISKDLGAVTAYAAAVNRGYTGTKEEFETLMASYATVAEQAQASATSAGQSATDASGSAQTAETAKNTAQQAATDAQTAQTQAQGYAQSAQASAQDAQDYAQNAESAKDTAVDAVDGFAAGAQQALDGVNQAGNNWKSLAQAQKLDAEAWATGKRDGEDVGSSDPAYHNNAKYYAESAGTDATTASDAAQTATQKASDAQTSAEAAAESARTLTIDSTLTQSGQAADSKAVGDALLRVPIAHVYDSDPELQAFVIGAVKSIGTLDNSTTTRIRTSGWLESEDIVSISTPDNQLALYAYSDVAPSPSSTYFIGGWNGSAFGTAAYVSSLDIQSIKTTYPDYKLILVARYSDNRTVSDIDDLLSGIVFMLKATPLNDVLDGINSRISGIEEDITIPFDFQIPVNISKTKAGYATDVVTQKYAYTKANGKTVFISPSGDDTNTGLTVISPMKTLESALAVADVATIILLSGTYESGVNFTAELSVNIPINFIGIGEVIIHNNGKPIVFTDTVYMYGITFDGGTQNTLTVNHSAGVYAVFERCTFRNARYYNGIQINGGRAILKDCKAYGNAYDGFNYHANGSVIVYALEVDCESYDNGHTSFSLESGQSSNASTSHDNCPIVRVNGTYYGCHGGVVADKDCNSANYGCTSGVSTITDEANYPDRMSNYWASGARMYLYDCVSYGSKYDTAVIRDGSIVSNVEYASNYTG